MNRFAIAQTSDRLAALELQARQCLVSCDPEAVHRLRVATRRLQSCLQTFESALPKKRARNFGKRLHQARSVAGGVRDCDIALELIGQCSPPQNSLLELLRRRREEASLELGALLESWQEEDFLERRRKKLHLESTPSCDDESIRKADLKAPGKRAAAVLAPLAGKFLRAGDKLAASLHDIPKLHRFRIRAKQLRYTLELFRPCYGAGLVKRLTALKLVQERLGRVNDCSTTRVLAAAEACRVGGLEEQAAALGEFVDRRQSDELTAFAALWAEHFQGRKARRRWTQYLAEPHGSDVGLGAGRSRVA